MSSRRLLSVLTPEDVIDDRVKAKLQPQVDHILAGVTVGDEGSCLS